MILSESVLKVNRWHGMHFTGIESELRGLGIEIYDIEHSAQTKSRLLIYRTQDAQHASAMMTHFRAWLGKTNRGRTMGQEIAEVHGAVMATHLPPQ